MVYVLTVCEQDQDGTGTSSVLTLHASKNKFEKLVHLVGFIMGTLNCCFAYEADRTTHTREAGIAACSVPGNVLQIFNNFWSSTVQVPQIYFCVTCSLTTHNLHGAVKVKVKVHPRPDHEVPDGESMYSFTLSLTSALDRGGWSAPYPGRFTAGKDPVPIV